MNQSNLNKEDLKNYVSTSSAGSLIGYSSDYVSKLAREKKIDAFRKKKQWFISKDSLKLFYLKSEADKRERKKILKNERLHEYLNAILREQEVKRVLNIGTTRGVALLETIAVTILFVVTGNVLWFSFGSELSTNELVDGFFEVSTQLSKVIVDPIPETISQIASVSFVKNDTNVLSDKPLDEQKYDLTNSGESKFQGIVILDDATTSVLFKNNNQVTEKSFSNEPDVRFTNDETGSMRPIFKDKNGNSYMFELMSIDNLSDN